MLLLLSTALATLPPSVMEPRLLADLDRHLAAPAAWSTQVGMETSAFPEGRLFSYLLPILAATNLAQRSEPAVAQARIATLLSLMIPEVMTTLKPPQGHLDLLADDQGQGTWLGSLDLALGAWRLVGGDDRYEGLHQHLSQILLADLQAKEGAPISSYPGFTWTMDTIPVLLALHLRDRVAPLPGTRAAIDAHLAWMDTHVEPTTGLPWSGLTRSGEPADGPRGCDLGLRIALLAELDPLRAQAMYQKFVQHFARDSSGFPGFAEWPSEVQRPADIDSGPILFGVGLSATGLGLGAARAVGDLERWQPMDRALASLPTVLPLMGALLGKGLGPTPLDPAQYLTGFLYGDAAVLWSVTWEDWGVALR